MVGHESIQVVQQAAQSSFKEWLIGGGAIFLITLTFWIGLTLGTIRQTMADFSEHLERVEGDVKSLIYGYEPRRRSSQKDH